MTFNLLHRYAHLASRSPNVLTEWGSDQASALVALRQSVETLSRIGRGGITDHLGGGISRYSVDVSDSTEPSSLSPSKANRSSLLRPSELLESSAFREDVI